MKIDITGVSANYARIGSLLIVGQSEHKQLLYQLTNDKRILRVDSAIKAKEIVREYVERFDLNFDLGIVSQSIRNIVFLGGESTTFMYPRGDKWAPIKEITRQRFALLYEENEFMVLK